VIEDDAVVAAMPRDSLFANRQRPFTGTTRRGRRVEEARVTDDEVLLLANLLLSKGNRERAHAIAVELDLRPASRSSAAERAVALPVV
jgi:hypothetical protein